MAVLTDIANIIRVKLEYKAGNDRALNILHYQVKSITNNASGLPAAISVPFQDLADDMASNMYNLWSNAWKTAASVSVVMSSCTVQNIWPAPRSRPYSFIPAAPIAGTVAGDAMPLQDSPTILKQTIYGERWGLGRVFFCGLSEASEQGGEVTAGWQTLATNFIDQVKTQVNSGGATWDVLLEPVLFSTTEEGGFNAYQISGSRLSDTIIKSMKTRRPGKGM